VQTLEAEVASLKGRSAAQVAPKHSENPLTRPESNLVREAPDTVLLEVLGKTQQSSLAKYFLTKTPDPLAEAANWLQLLKANPGDKKVQREAAEALERAAKRLMEEA
jgi:hypothetical protein